jgi:DNA polymerase III subunit epsilon
MAGRHAAAASGGRATGSGREMSVPRRTVVHVTDTYGGSAAAPDAPDAAVAPAAQGADALLRDLDFTVVDVETTGWSPDKAGITEIGAVRVRHGEVVAEFTSLVNPGTPVPAPITELTGISDRMLALAPPVAAVLPGLLAFAEGSVLTAHNAPFDLRFIVAACAAAGLGWPGFEVLDTVRLARHLMATPDEVPDRKLATLAEYFGTPVRPSHRALDDARATAVVLRELLGRLEDREGIRTLGGLTAWLAERDAAAAAAAAKAARRARRHRLARALRRRCGLGRPRRRRGRAPEGTRKDKVSRVT